MLINGSLVLNLAYGAFFGLWEERKAEVVKDRGKSSAVKAAGDYQSSMTQEGGRLLTPKVNRYL